MQVLQEFVPNLLDDLLSGRITPDGALIAGQQYPYLRQLIAQRGDEVAASMQDDEKLRKIIETILREAVIAVRRELPQFQVEKPDAPLTPNEIVARAGEWRRARADVGIAIQNQRGEVGRLRKTFINRLVQNWIAQTKVGLDHEQQQQLAQALQAELEGGLGADVSATEIVARVWEAIARTRVGEAVMRAVQRETAPVQQELIAATQRLAGVAAIPKELLRRASAGHPEVFTALAIQTIFSSTLSPAAAIHKAASLAHVAGAFTEKAPGGQDVTAAGVFFRAFASGPAQKAFAAAADALLNQLSPLARQEVIKAMFSRALEGVLEKTDVLTRRLGREFVESELFRVVVGSAQKEFARAAGGGAEARRARGALEDLIGSLLRGPVAGPLVGSPKEMMLAYFELFAAETKLDRGKKILFPDHASTVTVLGLTPQGQSGGQGVETLAASGFASPQAFRAAVARFTYRLPSWQAFYTALLAPVFWQRVLISLGREGQRVVSAPGSLGVGVSSFFGAVGRDVATGAGRFGLSLVEGAGGWLTSVLFGGGLGSLFNRFRGPRQPEGFFDDTPKLLAVVIVVVIVLLFIFPSFFNAKLTSQAAKYAALLVNSQEPNTGGPYDPLEDEVFADPAAYAGDLLCPVGRQPISQSAFVEGESHEDLCAYDFAAPKGTVVTMTHGGCITAMESGIPVDQYKDRSYGNHIKLKGKTPDGKTFYTIYGHMYDMNPNLALGGCYEAGTTIGRVDATGSTYSSVRGKKKLGGATHLHYEYRDEAGGCIELPAACR